MIYKTLDAMEDSDSLLNVYQYTSFRDFGLTIRNKFQMSKHDSLDHAPKLRTMICVDQPRWKRTL
jgi:hypothetical protein